MKIHRRTLRIAHHKLNPVYAAHIRNLMRIAHDRGCPLRQHRPRIARRRQHRRLDMYVRVGKPRHQIRPAGVIFPLALIAADAGYPTVADCRITVDNSAVEHIDNFGIFDNELRLFVTERTVYHLFNLHKNTSVNP